MAIDLTIAGAVFAASFVGVALAKALFWRRRWKTGKDAVGRRTLLRFDLIDAFLQASFFGLLFASPSGNAWWFGGVIVAGVAKIFLVDGPLERWRDKRIAAQAGPQQSP